MTTRRVRSRKRGIDSAEDEVRRHHRRAARAPAASASHRTTAVSQLLALQKSAGNQAVARLVESGQVQRAIGKKIAGMFGKKTRSGPEDPRSEQSKAMAVIFAGNDPVTGLPWDTIGHHIIAILNHDFGIPKGGMGGGYGAWSEMTLDWVPKPETMQWAISEESGFNLRLRSFLERFFIHKGWLKRRPAPPVPHAVSGNGGGGGSKP